MAANSSEECQSVHNVVILTDGGASDQKFEPQLNISYLEVPSTMKSEMCLDSETNLHNRTNLEVDKVNSYATCILDVDVEKGHGEIKFSDESVQNFKSDDSLARALLREICLQVGGKLTQLLMNHVAELPKFTSRERVHDALTNKARKFKRSPSFNSRRVVLLFSVLSILGTIILIYLTLRNGSGNV